MVIAIDGKWIWDGWYAHDGERWHGLFLQADRSLGDPDLRHFNVSQGHATSTDLVSWEHLGTCLSPSTEPAWDDYTTWTGSVVRGDDGLWHLFYTGTRRSEAGLYQRIGHATSSDLHGWERVGDGFCLGLAGPEATAYEAEHVLGHWHDRAMRDPWVMRDPEGGGWLMFFTARVPGRAEPSAGGGHRPRDLARPPPMDASAAHLRRRRLWAVRGATGVRARGPLVLPVLHVGPPLGGGHQGRARGGAGGGHPLPRRRRATGPWRVAPRPLLDMDPVGMRYAARVVEAPEGLRLMGFCDRGRENFGGWVMDPDPVEVGPDGLLRVAADRGR